MITINKSLPSSPYSVQMVQPDTPVSQLSPDQELYNAVERLLPDDNPFRRTIGLYLSVISYYANIEEGSRRFSGQVVFILNQFCPEQDDGTREVDGRVFNATRDNLQEFILRVISAHIDISNLIGETQE